MISRWRGGMDAGASWRFGSGNSRMSRDTTGHVVASGMLAGKAESAPGAAALGAEFEALSMPLAETLFATAFRITGNAARAEDLVQEAYVLAWQKFAQYQRGSNFKAWLFRILILTSKNEMRTQRKQPAQLGDDTAHIVTPNDSEQTGMSAPLGFFDHAEIGDDDFKRAVDRLDTSHRTILMMVTLGELSYQECADSLSLPLGTVMSRLHRARKQLQADLYEYAREKGILRGNAGGGGP